MTSEEKIARLEAQVAALAAKLNEVIYDFNNHDHPVHIESNGYGETYNHQTAESMDYKDHIEELDLNKVIDENGIG